MILQSGNKWFLSTRAQELKTAMRCLVRLRVLLPHYVHLLARLENKGKTDVPLQRIVWGLPSSCHIVVICVPTCHLLFRFIRVRGPRDPMLSTFMFIGFIMASMLNKYMVNEWIKFFLNSHILGQAGLSYKGWGCRSVQPVACGLHATWDSYECGPTQNHKFS